MGDRANVYVQDGTSGVYLYTHGGGYDLPEIVQTALQRKLRWDDPQYLARIIFCAMVRDDIDGETGFGISAEIHDNERLVIVVSDQRIGFATPPGRGHTPIPGKWWTFDEYIDLSADEIRRAYETDYERALRLREADVSDPDDGDA